MDDTTGTASSLPVQVEIPGYRLRRQVGSDSIGLWFDAEQESLGRKVTLKILKPKYEGHPAAQQQFLTEMDRLAALDHANLARVLDSRREGLLVLVTERIGVRSVATLLQPAKPVPEDRVLGCLIGATRALRYLARQKLAHKNVSPPLIMVRDDGSTRLVTFRNIIPAAEQAALKGKLAQDVRYIAPEQLTGPAIVGPKAHVYQIGAIAFHMLTGIPPFAGGDAKQIAKARLEAPFPSVRKVQPFMNKGLANLVAACTQRDPDPRPTLDELVTAFEMLIGGKDPGLEPQPEPDPQRPLGGPIVAPRPRRRRRRRY